MTGCEHNRSHNDASWVRDQSRHSPAALANEKMLPRYAASSAWLNALLIPGARVGIAVL